MNKPELGWTTNAKLFRIIDADTIEIEINRTLCVRLKDLLAEEKEKDAGKTAKEWLVAQLPPGTELVVFFPANNPTKLMDMNSFERVLGYVWLTINNVCTNLADYVVANGYGRYIKNKEKPRRGI